MSGLSAVVFEAERPRDAATFWSVLLGAERSTSADGGEVVHLRNGPALRLVPASAPKTVKNRIHLDLAGGRDAGDQQNTVDRAIRLGATTIDIGQHDGGAVPWVVLADPAGNEFCVLEPRASYADTGPLAAVVVDSADPRRSAEFWSVAAGWPVGREDPVCVGLRAPHGRGPWLELLRVDDRPPAAPRCRVELSVPDGPAGLTDEAERLTRLGALRRGAGRLTDPDGGVIDLVSVT
ncbi:VOC family protein [Saccharomonospora sp. CUA-673]|uniref:VOC family protein n=1 Tax=Saccharomonospora sp. CUA-673 TaxID=1904969 RepID=UPI000AB2AE33|nr:VOC family protein [Saccharomonospora sp. CUA-673]